ncbi:YdeI/OmpD-associated family protein [Adhaeribacter soli]|uniref:DUF1905 domain-containing protein n=1 Tax=Adhaeribacter soli TaxID=2607655 RepID=A0A5N1IPN7_9BACT|nr:YdeI/OmpD-associated family protein [Adhaeribacter soli]KAA9331921.1 DUF1905 domain-containing protein [Adhaeribacter soli]
METPLVDKDYLLEKFPGKGGWTYALIPEIPQDKKAWFGLVKVRGSIDGFPVENANLMPMGGGKLFLPVKTAIRKKIGKEAGDRVRIVLYAQHGVNNVREELLLCLEDEPKALKQFQELPEGNQQEMLYWISAAKSEDEKVRRIAQCMDTLLLSAKSLV